ncbi:MAG: hypothetical protein AAGA93_19125, partial [Actinomycetota bacterium]
GSPWSTTGLCLGDGESGDGIDGALRGGSASSLSGVVTLGGQPADGIGVDLFIAGADGGRDRFLASTETGDDGQAGRFRFEVDPGCYVLTYVGDGRTFVASGSGWLNRGVCVAAGASVDDLDAVIAPARAATIRTGVVQNGQPVADVAIDLFADDGAGGRGAYRSTVRTDGAGAAAFAVDPGCHVLTHVAPTDQRWTETGDAWLNRAVCVEAGETAVLQPAVLDGASQQIVIDVTVRQEGIKVAASVDVFEAEADGSRGRYVTSAVTPDRPAGVTRIGIDDGAGCWVVTFIAPDGDVFESTGTTWSNRFFCTTPDQIGYDLLEVLAPPTSRTITLAIDDGPHQVTEEVTGTSGLDLRVTGTPGDQVALELLDPDGETSCPTGYRLAVVVKTATAIIDPSTWEICDTLGPWTLPADGALTIGFRPADIDPIRVRALVAEVDYEDVAIDLAPDTSQTVSGRIETPREGTDYIVAGEPGQFIGVDFAGPICGLQYSRITAQILDPDGFPLQRFSRNGPQCRPYGPWEIPADGFLTVRVFQDQGVITLDPADYEVTISLIDYEDVIVPPGTDVLEFSGSIDVPFDGTDYLFDATTFDSLVLTLLEPEFSARCDQPTDLVISAAIDIDGPGGGTGPSCGRLSTEVDATGATSVLVRFRGSTSLTQAVTGSYRFRAEQRVDDRIAVDVRDGPVDLTGSIDHWADEVTFVVTAEPGTMVSAADVEQWWSGASCRWLGYLELHMRAYDLRGEALDVGWERECSRQGPWIVPDDGVVVLEAKANQHDVGDYRYRFAAFDAVDVDVDVTAGPVTVSGRHLHPLQGTTYRLTGPPGQQVEAVVTELQADAGGATCETRLLAVRIDRLSPPFRTESDDVGYNGCNSYGPWYIGDDGLLHLRVLAAGTGTEFEGSYTMTFELRGP